MNWDAVGAVAEMVGALAVVLSLVYLGRQIHHTGRQFQSQIEDQIQTKLFQAYDPVYEGRNAEIIYNGLNDFGALSGPDRLVFLFLMDRQIGVLAMIARRAHAGHYPMNEIDNAVHAFKRKFLADEKARVWFDHYVSDFQPQHKKYLQQLLSED